MSKSLPPPRRPAAHYRATLATPQPQLTPTLPLRLDPVTDIAPGPPSAGGSCASGFTSAAGSSTAAAAGASTTSAASSSAAVADLSSAEMDNHLAMLEDLGPPGASRRPTRRVKSIERTWAWVRSRSSVYGEQALMGLVAMHDDEPPPQESPRPLTVATGNLPESSSVDSVSTLRRQSGADMDPEERRKRRQGLTPESLRPPPRRPRPITRSQTAPTPALNSPPPPRAFPTSTSTPNSSANPPRDPPPPPPPVPRVNGSAPTSASASAYPRPRQPRPAAILGPTTSMPASPTSSTSSTRTPVQSIHDIVKRHSSALSLAEANVKDRARAELASRPDLLDRRRAVATPVPVEEEEDEDHDDQDNELELDGRWTMVENANSPQAPPLPPKIVANHQSHRREPSKASLSSYYSSSDTDSVVRDFRVAQAAFDQLSTSKTPQPSMPAPAPVVQPPTPTRTTNIYAPSPERSPRGKYPGGGRSPDAEVLSRQRSATSLLRPKSASPLPVEDDARDIAMYLRSPQLNRILHLPRPFPERNLQVSFADLGKADGRPVVIFLGLGSVRYLVSLYDDLARALGLRLICIDRWGLGKTDQVPQDRRGLLDWADVVRQVLDALNIDRFQIVAHSAGAPYALATALKLQRRVQGKIHLLSPWIGGEVEGYKWLKWVPNGVIKSALAAEWRVESYFLGKAPTLKTMNGKANGGSPARSRDDNASTMSLPTDGLRSRSSFNDQRSNGGSLDGFSDDLYNALPPDGAAVSPITASPAFAHALTQANHAESLSGTTADLLSVVLGRDAKPWGFSYTDIRHPCKIWYGADDDRVSEKSMRWMERAMDAELIVVPEEGHNLMSSRTVMYNVLDSIAEDH